MKNNNFDISKTEKLLSGLGSEIEQKCLELKENRKMMILRRVFFLTCLLVIILPLIDVFFGFSILITLFPVLIFQAVSLTLLVPVILNSLEGGNHIERIR
jgi:hypothetical protein